MSSGVGTVSREIVVNTAQHYNFIQVAAAITHPDKGKIFDLSSDINAYLGITDSSVILYPYDGYGDPDLIRQLMKMHKIDAIMIYTDPRFFIWFFQMEHEIRQEVPVFYYNIWDDLPYPRYNKLYYESCDALFSISKQTLNINRQVLGDNNYEEI